MFNKQDVNRRPRQLSFFSHSPPNTSSSSLCIDKLRQELKKSDAPEALVSTKIRIANTKLAEKIDIAETPNNLVEALLEWEKELDTLSQAIPPELECCREVFAQMIVDIMLEQKGKHFHAVLSGHTHIINRAQLITRHGSAIRNLFGFDSTTAWWAVAIAVVQTVLAAMMNDTSWSSYFLVMVFLGSILNHAAGMAIHEASHNLAAPLPILNRAVSIIANLPLGVPHQANFERYHPDHHSYLGQPDRDNDLPSPILARWVGNSSIKKALWLAFYPLAYSVTQKPDRPNWKQVANILVQLGWDAGIVYYLGPWALAYLIGSTLIGFSALNPVAAHWVDEHFERNGDGQETHSYYGWLNKLNFEVGHHNEHHDFPTIPGSRLPELHRIAKEHYGIKQSNTSWLKTIWQFITDPTISAHSRIIRTSKAQYSANKEAARILSLNRDHVADSTESQTYGL